MMKILKIKKRIKRRLPFAEKIMPDNIDERRKKMMWTKNNLFSIFYACQ
jgi:hypothetical protein